MSPISSNCAVALVMDVLVRFSLFATSLFNTDSSSLIYNNSRNTICVAGIILSALTSCLRYTSCNTIPINGKNTFPGKFTNGTPLFTRAFLMDTLFIATSYATGHCNASSYFAFCFFIAATLSSVSFITSIMAKVTPYISTITISRIVIKIGNGNLFLYSAIFTSQPKYCSNSFFIWRLLITYFFV